MNTVQTYLNLITSEHADKPDFTAMLTAIIQPFVDNQILLGTFPTLFDLDYAAGAQLDVVGQWVGLSRQLNAPIAGVYFAFDTAGVGFDEGVWFGPHDPVEGLVSLDDETYRTFLRIKIAANHWDGSMEQAQTILGAIFADSPGTLFFIEDTFDMAVTYGLSGVLPSQLLISLLSDGYIALRPAGVKQNTVITSVTGAPIFGFDVNNAYIGGFDVGAWGTPL